VHHPAPARRVDPTEANSQSGISPPIDMSYLQANLPDPLGVSSTPLLRAARLQGDFPRTHTRSRWSYPKADPRVRHRYKYLFVQSFIIIINIS